MGMRRMQGSCASDQLLDRLELEDEQPVADEGQAPYLPAGLLHVVGLGDEVYPRAVAEPVEVLHDALGVEFGQDPRLLGPVGGELAGSGMVPVGRYMGDPPIFRGTVQGHRRVASVTT